MRVQHLHERFGNFGKFVIEFAMDTCCQERECLDHAFDVRVFALVAFERETARYFWIALRKFA